MSSETLLAASAAAEAEAAKGAVHFRAYFGDLLEKREFLFSGEQGDSSQVIEEAVGRISVGGGVCVFHDFQRVLDGVMGRGVDAGSGF